MAPKPKKQSEKSLAEMEQTAPEIAKDAFSEARQEALDAGLSVMVLSRGKIYRVDPDGKRTFVKDIGPRARVSKGSKIKVD